MRGEGMYPDRESNSELSFRRALLYPFNYQGLSCICWHEYHAPQDFYGAKVIIFPLMSKGFMQNMMLLVEKNVILIFFAY